MRVDGVGLGQERGPEIGLRLIVLELRDSPGQTAGHFRESSGMPCGAGAARRHVQVGVALDDIDDVEQIVRSAPQRGGTAGRFRVVIFVQLKVDLVQHRLQVNGRQRRGIGGFAIFDLRQHGRIAEDLGQTLLNRGEVVGDLVEIRRVDAAGGGNGGRVEDFADRFQAVARRRRGERCRIIGARRNVLERDVVGTRVGQELDVVEGGRNMGVVVDLLQDLALHGMDRLIRRRQRRRIGGLRRSGQERAELALDVGQDRGVGGAEGKGLTAERHIAGSGEHRGDVVLHRMDVGRVAAQEGVGVAAA